jgi:hypothetical protein
MGVPCAFAMPTTNLARGPNAETADDVWERLDRLAERYERRSLALQTSRTGPLAVEHHLQGVARIDHPGGLSTLVCSCSGKDSGTLWFGSFPREDDRSPQGRLRTRLARRGTTKSTIVTALRHPGGMQALGTWLAVANEGGPGSPSVDLYDVSQPATPRLHARLDLPGAGGAGWVALAARGPDDIILFIGGASFARRDSWLYSYCPSRNTFRREGTFAGRPVSTLPPEAAWGPQSGASLFVESDGTISLITQGSKGDSGNDAYRERLRCYDLQLASSAQGGVVTLTQQPRGASENYVIDADPHPPRLGALFFRTPGLRWGSTVFSDANGELILYATARNAIPNRDGVHVLEIVEVRQRMP